MRMQPIDSLCDLSPGLVLDARHGMRNGVSKRFGIGTFLRAVPRHLSFSSNPLGSDAQRELARFKSSQESINSPKAHTHIALADSQMMFRAQEELARTRVGNSHQGTTAEAHKAPSKITVNPCHFWEVPTISCILSK